MTRVALPAILTLALAASLGGAQRAPYDYCNLTTWTGKGLLSYPLNVNSGAISSTQPGGSIY
jgi:hypothetical protein